MKRILGLFLLFLTTSAVFGLVDINRSSARAPETIDTLDYFVSKHPGQALDGSHNQNQVVAGNVSYYVKWDPAAYEVHTWDDNYIYLREDHSWQYDKGYAFQPGRWMKRSMKIDESISESGNVGYYFDYLGCQLTNTSPILYTMTLEKHIVNYHLGGDLGRQEVIVLKYDYSTTANPGNFERFYYSKEWGWVKWELYSHNKLTQTSIFNKISDKPLAPDINSSCTHSGTATDTVIYPYSLFRLMTGKVVRLTNSPALYYITRQAQRQYLCEPRILFDYGVTAKDIEDISSEDLSYYPPLVYVRFQGAVYKLDGSQMHLLKPDAYEQHHINVAQLPSVTSAEVSCYTAGPVIFASAGQP